MGKDEMAPLLMLLPSLFGAILCVTSNTQDSRCAVVLYWLPVSIKTIKMGFLVRCELMALVLWDRDAACSCEHS